MQHTITDDLEALLVALPPRIHEAVNWLDNRGELLEIVMDLGRQPEGRFACHLRRPRIRGRAHR